MIRDTAKAVERARELTRDELDAVSGGRKAGGDPQFFDVFSRLQAEGGGSGAGKIIGILVG